MNKLLKLSIFGATSAVLYLAAPIGGEVALAGPVGLAAPNAVAMPAATESVAYRRIYHGRTVYGGRHYGWHRGWHRHILHGRSAYYHGRSAYCPPVHHPCYDRCEGRSAYVAPSRVIIERRTAYVAAPVARVLAVPVVYQAYTYGYPSGYGLGGGGLFGGLFGAGFGGGWGW